MQGNPLEEFFLHPIIRLHLLGFDISVTQAVISLWLMVGITALASLYFVRVSALVPGRFQTTLEMLFETLTTVVDENVGAENRKKFLLPIFVLFLFVFLSNFPEDIPDSGSRSGHTDRRGTHTDQRCCMHIHEKVPPDD